MTDDESTDEPSGGCGGGGSSVAKLFRLAFRPISGSLLL